MIPEDDFSLIFHSPLSTSNIPIYRYTGAVLEILLSSFQAACLSRMVRWDLHAEFLVTLQHKFLRRSPIFLRGDQKKKRSSLHFLN